MFACFKIDEYNKEGLAQAFVKFLEKESQPRPASGQQSQSPTLLNITSQTRSSPVNPLHQIPVITSTSGSSTMPEAVAAIQPVQPILLSEGLLMQNFAPTRNSSSILKDILNDS